MLTLDLDKLFTTDLLQAFRRNWGLLPQDADRLAQKIVGIFEEKAGQGNQPLAEARRRAWLRTLISALVGPEPDFDAWVEAIARGSFDVRPQVTYARARDAGSPSRFLLRQRQKIQGLVDQDLPDHEQELQHRAYMDALRQVIVSLVILEMKRAVSTRSAVGTAWPITLAARDHLSAESKALLHHFGGDLEFRTKLGDGIETAINEWVKAGCDGNAPDVPKEAHKRRLPPGINHHRALTEIDRETAAIDEYRRALWDELGLDGEPMAAAGNCPSPKTLAAKDGPIIRAAQGPSSAEEFRYFREANGGKKVFEYDDQDRERLKLLLPILATDPVDPRLVAYAADRAERRAELRELAPRSQLDLELQEEIFRWVDAENPPPVKLRPEHAGYFEEEICRRFRDSFTTNGAWEKLPFRFPERLF